MTIRPYRPSDATLVDDLYERVFGPELRSHFRRRWSWEFEDAPSVWTAGNLVAERDGHIVAHLGRLPTRLSIAGSVMPCAFLTDLMADPNGSGLVSLRLINEGLRDLPVAMLVGAKPTTQELYARVGMQRLPIGDIHVRIERPDGAMAAALYRLLRRRFTGLERYVRRWPFAIPGLIARPFVALWQHAPRPRWTATFGIERLRGFDARFDDLWVAMHERCRVACVRDRRFLEWRYGDGLADQYTVLAAFGERGSLAAAAVLTSIGVGPGRYGKLMECLYRDEPSLEAIIDGSLAEFRRTGVDFIVAPGLSRETHAVLRDRGFRRSSRKRGFAIRANTADAIARVLSDPACWYISPGDGDEDFTETVTAEAPQRQPRTA